jgi:uncharacterized phage protein (TIGR01671 family)
MQYSGLKDKNGKGIYEGDFLLIKESIEHGDGWENEVLEVKYEDCCFFGITDNSKEYLAHLECQKIIGNIYQNPELMK